MNRVSVGWRSIPVNADLGQISIGYDLWSMGSVLLTLLAMKQVIDEEPYQQATIRSVWT